MKSKGITRRSLLAGGLVGLSGWIQGCSAGKAQDTVTLQGRTFSGNRGTASGGAGGEGIRATDGMHITNCRFQDLGNGAVRIATPVNQLTIEDCQADNMYRFLEGTASQGIAEASLRDFIVRRVQAHRLEHGFLRLRYQSARGLIEDVTATCRESGGDLYCVGFALDDEASDIVYRRVSAHGFREVTRSAGSYWNGDGFTDERGNRAIRYIDCLAADCTDGGFDLKSADVLLERCIAERNKRNFRLWSSGELRDCESREPVWRGGSGGKSHFSFHGDVGAYRIVRPKVRSPEGNNAPVFVFDTNAPAHVVIEDADIDAPSAPLFKVEGGPQPDIVFVPERSQQRIRTAS
jgi:hypothetical protein